MSPRPPLSLAAAALVAAVLSAQPAHAGGPTQPPDGAFAGFATYYRIPPVVISDGSAAQCLRVLCWSLTHDGVDVGIELWTAGPDPGRDPFETGSLVLDVASIDSATLCHAGTSSAFGRILAEPIKKLAIECTAEIVSNSSFQTISSVPLVSTPPRKKKKR
jgi:hypothetical protein